LFQGYGLLWACIKLKLYCSIHTNILPHITRLVKLYRAFLCKQRRVTPLSRLIRSGIPLSAKADSPLPHNQWFQVLLIDTWCEVKSTE
jgi:hypothetical protein